MLKVYEIYQSIQGEGSQAGMPCVFIRLAGCPLRCSYCDTPQALSPDSGELMSIDTIVDTVMGYLPSLILVTGGEPLAQPECIALLQHLVELRYHVQLETSGAFDITDTPPSVQKILDIKTPASGQEEQNLWGNLALLQEHDEIKFVLANRDDYLWCKKIIEDRLPDTPASILLSPVYNMLQASDLCAWMLEDHLPVRLNMQLHKIIWGGDAVGV
ncbi:MAG: radical SAM protein [Mariprofundaceae bacterium]|nr:radical SAM protein [Mariprofundaceae bacterium]